MTEKEYISMSEFLKMYKINRLSMKTKMLNRYTNGLAKYVYRFTDSPTLKSRIFFPKERIDVWVMENYPEKWWSYQSFKKSTAS